MDKDDNRPVQPIAVRDGEIVETEVGLIGSENSLHDRLTEPTRHKIGDYMILVAAVCVKLVELYGTNLAADPRLQQLPLPANDDTPP